MVESLVRTLVEYGSDYEHRSRMYQTCRVIFFNNKDMVEAQISSEFG